GDKQRLGVRELLGDPRERVAKLGGTLARGRFFFLERLELLGELGELGVELCYVFDILLGLGVAIAARTLELGVGCGDGAGVPAAFFLDGLQGVARLAERRMIEGIGADRGA